MKSQNTQDQRILFAKIVLEKYRLGWTFAIPPEITVEEQVDMFERRMARIKQEVWSERLGSIRIEHPADWQTALAALVTELARVRAAIAAWAEAHDHGMMWECEGCAALLAEAGR